MTISHKAVRRFVWVLVTILFLLTILEQVRKLGGWYSYYAEWILSFLGLSTIGPKCVGILGEIECWRRGLPNRWWYRRMRCEGAMYGGRRGEGAAPSVDFAKDAFDKPKQPSDAAYDVVKETWDKSVQYVWDRSIGYLWDNPIQYIIVAVTIWYQQFRNAWFPPSVSDRGRPQAADGIEIRDPDENVTSPENASQIKERPPPPKISWADWLLSVLEGGGEKNPFVPEKIPADDSSLEVVPVDLTDIANITDSITKSNNNWVDWFRKARSGGKKSVEEVAEEIVEEIVEETPDLEIEDLIPEDTKQTFKDVKSNWTKWAEDVWRAVPGSSYFGSRKTDSPEPVYIPEVDDFSLQKPSDEPEVPEITRTKPVNPVTWLASALWSITVGCFLFFWIPAAGLFVSLWSPVIPFFMAFWMPLSEYTGFFIWRTIVGFFVSSWNQLLRVPQILGSGFLGILRAVWNFWVPIFSPIFNPIARPFKWLWYIDIGVPAEFIFWLQQTLRQLGWQFGFVTAVFIAWCGKFGAKLLSGEIFRMLFRAIDWVGESWLWQNVVDWLLWQWVFKTIILTLAIAFAIPVTIRAALGLLAWIYCAVTRTTSLKRLRDIPNELRWYSYLALVFLIWTTIHYWLLLVDRVSALDVKISGQRDVRSYVPWYLVILVVMWLYSKVAVFAKTALVILSNIFVSVPIAIFNQIREYFRPAFPYVSRAFRSVVNIPRYFLRPSWEQAIKDSFVALKDGIMHPRVPWLVQLMNALMIFFVVAMYIMSAVCTIVILKMGGWVGTLSLCAYGALMFYYKVYSHGRLRYDSGNASHGVHAIIEARDGRSYNEREWQIVNPDLLLFLIISFATLSLLKLDDNSEVFFTAFSRMFFDLEPLHEYLDSTSMPKVIFIYVTAILSWIFGHNLFSVLDDTSILGYTFTVPRISRRSTIALFLALPAVFFNIVVIAVSSLLATSDIHSPSRWKTKFVAIIAIIILVLPIYIWRLIQVIITLPQTIIRYILEKIGIVKLYTPRPAPTGDNDSTDSGNGGPGGPGGGGGGGGPPGGGGSNDGSDHGGHGGQGPITEAEAVIVETPIVYIEHEPGDEVDMDIPEAIDEPVVGSSQSTTDSVDSTEAANKVLEDAKIHLYRVKSQQQIDEDALRAWRNTPESLDRVPLQQAPELSRIAEESEPHSSQENKPHFKPDSKKASESTLLSDEIEERNWWSLSTERNEALTVERPEGRAGQRPDDEPVINTPPRDNEEAEPVKPAEEVAPVAESLSEKTSREKDAAFLAEQRNRLELAIQGKTHEFILVGLPDYATTKVGENLNLDDTTTKVGENSKPDGDTSDRILASLNAAIAQEDKLLIPHLPEDGGSVSDLVPEKIEKAHAQRIADAKLIDKYYEEGMRRLELQGFNEELDEFESVSPKTTQERPAEAENLVPEKEVVVESKSASPPPFKPPQNIRHSDNNEVAVESGSASPIPFRQPRNMVEKPTTGDPPSDLLPGGEGRFLSNSSAEKVPLPDSPKGKSNTYVEATQVPASSLKNKPKAEASMEAAPRH